MPLLSDDPGLSEWDDYHPVTLCPGHVEPTNAVEVPLARLGDLYDNYAELLYRKTGIWPSNISGTRDETIIHEQYHAEVFKALDAKMVLGGIRFGVSTEEFGRTVLSTTPYTVAPDVKTFKLGAAAMLLAPPDPSEGDLNTFKNYGYTPVELHAKISDHNSRGRGPYIPPSQYSGL